MPYLFTCPHCQSKTVVDDQYSGHCGNCVSCGKPIEVPDFIQTPSTSYSTLPRRDSRLLRLIGGISVSVFIIILIGFIALRFGAESLQQFAVSRERNLCMQNLGKIAKALNAYATDYGTYPPPYTTNSQGTPLMSWRVLILPYLGYGNLYSEIDLEQPWSSDKNFPINERMPPVFASPGYYVSGTAVSSYYLVTGPGTLFPLNSPPLGPSDVSDDPWKTILVVESANANQTTNSWMDPLGDLLISQLNMPLGSSGIGGSHEDGATIVTVDGTPHWISQNVEPAILSALGTINGGEAISDDILQ